jgi:fumarylacetoacetase
MSSFVPVAPESHFPIQNLPYGVFVRKDHQEPHIGVAIGEHVLDLFVIANAGLFNDAQIASALKSSTLNNFMSLGRPSWKSARAAITQLLSVDSPTLRDNQELRSQALVLQKDVKMQVPAQIGDYTDFYSSREHATNVGIMFRGKENALMPNWLHLPVGYHGRSSSIVVSGTDVKRPCGQITEQENKPIFSKCKQLDFELETVSLFFFLFSFLISSFYDYHFIILLFYYFIILLIKFN